MKAWRTAGEIVLVVLTTLIFRRGLDMLAIYLHGRMTP